jgi:hypothetical protein
MSAFQTLSLDDISLLLGLDAEKTLEYLEGLIRKNKLPFFIDPIAN